jgi:hypothetical protein
MSIEYKPNGPSHDDDLALRVDLIEKTLETILGQEDKILELNELAETLKFEIDSIRMYLNETNRDYSNALAVALGNIADLVKQVYSMRLTSSVQSLQIQACYVDLNYGVNGIMQLKVRAATWKGSAGRRPYGYMRLNGDIDTILTTAYEGRPLYEGPVYIHLNLNYSLSSPIHDVGRKYMLEVTFGVGLEPMGPIPGNSNGTYFSSSALALVDAEGGLVDVLIPIDTDAILNTSTFAVDRQPLIHVTLLAIMNARGEILIPDPSPAVNEEAEFECSIDVFAPELLVTGKDLSGSVAIPGIPSRPLEKL